MTIALKVNYRFRTVRVPKITKRDKGFYLRVWRAERDLTRAQAARVFGINPSHWSLMEDGRRNASPKLAAKLAAATKQPLELFLGIAVSR